MIRKLPHAFQPVSRTSLLIGRRNHQPRLRHHSGIETILVRAVVRMSGYDATAQNTTHTALRLRIRLTLRRAHRAGKRIEDSRTRRFRPFA